MERNRQTKGRDFLRHLTRNIIPALAFAGIAGSLAGVVVFFFKLAAELVSEESDVLYRYVAAHPVWVPLLLVVALFLALLMAGIVRLIPEARGGGIPLSEGAARGVLKIRWFAALCGAIAGSMVGYFAGLPLGTEGPAVLIGTGVGQGMDSIYPSAWKRYLITSGASAGFAVATGAPVAAILFALEEIHRRFSPVILIVAGIAVAFGLGVAEALAGVFQFDLRLLSMGSVPSLPIHFLWVAPVVGVCAGGFACLFNFTVQRFGQFSDQKLRRVPQFAKLAVLFVAVAVVGLFVPELRGGGASLIHRVADMDVAIWLLGVALLLKFVFLTFCCGVGATGGTFVPMLALGALLGGLIEAALTAMGFPADYARTLVVLTIAAFLAASMQAPVMAVVFVMESSGSIGNTLPLVIAAFVAFFITETLKVESWNDMSLHRLTRNARRGQTFTLETFWVGVKKGSFAAGKRVSDIMWPPTAVVRFALDTPDEKGTPRVTTGGNRVLHEGDLLQVEAETADRAQTEAELNLITGPRHIKREQ